MARFTVVYEATARIFVEVELDVSNLGGMAFETAIRAAADEKFATMARPQLCDSCDETIDLGEFEQDYDDDGIRRHFT